MNTLNSHNTTQHKPSNSVITQNYSINWEYSIKTKQLHNRVTFWLFEAMIESSSFVKVFTTCLRLLAVSVDKGIFFRSSNSFFISLISDSFWVTLPCNTPSSFIIALKLVVRKDMNGLSWEKLPGLEKTRMLLSW